uniref:Uncharacterized protein n=1 Tax=Acrobeloides nanus TaxID=290746 RepID=A0A914CIV3_9BILA
MKGWSFLIFCLTLSFASEVLGTPSSNYTARRISYQKTGDSYNNGYQHGYGYGKSSSSESSESDSKSCERKECAAPKNVAKLYVAPGILSYDSEYSREPEVICPCTRGSQQFFKPSLFSTAGGNDYDYNQCAYILTSDPDYMCENMCIRDTDGNFWKPTDDNTYVFLTPSCLGGECHVYVSVETGSIKKEGASDTVDDSTPVDIYSELMLPNSRYIKADAISCNECGSIKPEVTENCYGPAQFYNIQLDSAKRQSSNEKCENSVGQESCETPTGKIPLFVEYGAIAEEGYYQQIPNSICPCDGGSLQFFSPTIYKLPDDAYDNYELAYYLYSYDEYESCQRICLRDVDGNFWEGYDEAEVFLVPSCDDGKCYIYAAVYDGILRNVQTGEVQAEGDSGVSYYLDNVGPDSKYPKIVAMSCGGCDKIKEIDKCYGPRE